MKTYQLISKTLKKITFFSTAKQTNRTGPGLVRFTSQRLNRLGFDKNDFGADKLQQLKKITMFVLHYIFMNKTKKIL